MKRISLILMAMLFIYNVFGQITLSTENTPKAETKYFFVEATNSNITFDTIGQDIVWDMSYLNLSEDSTYLYYTESVNFNPFPELGDDFPLDQFCDPSLYNLRSPGALYNTEESRYSKAYELWTIYYEGGSHEMPYYVNKTILEFPFSYNDSIVSSWTSYGVNSAIRIIKSKSFGTLILPDESSSSVLLVHTFEKIEREPYPPDTPHCTYDTLIYNRYAWYDSNHDVPILEVTYRERRWFNDGGSKYVTIDYDTTSFVFSHKNSLVGTTETMISNNSINIYPNPANNRIFINFDNEYKDLELQLYDITGKTIKSFHRKDILPNQNIILETGNIPEGLYILHISTPSQTVVNEKIIIN